MADKLVSVNDDYDFPAPVAARQAARLGDATTAEGKALAATYAKPFSVGERLRRAASKAQTQNSIEAPLHPSPPVITTSAPDPDTTLNRAFYVTTGQADCFKFYGGTPAIYGSVYYRFPVVTLPSGVGNSTATQDSVGWAVEFMTDAPKVTLTLMCSGSVRGFQIEVDGQRVTSAAIPFPVVNAPGHALLDFTSAGGRKTRRIRIEGDAASGFRGVKVNQVYRVWKPSDSENIRVASVGDSVSQQTGATLPNGGWNAIMGKLLGWTDVRQIAIGGTGWVVKGSYNSNLGDSTRVADVVAVKPDALVLSTSGNDKDVPQADLTSAILAGLRAYRAALPHIPIFMFGAWAGSSGPSTTVTRTETAALDAFTQFADGNSWFIPNTNDPMGSWSFGTGLALTPNNSGNSDFYGADVAHPNQEGHEYYGRRAAVALRERALPHVK